MKREKGKKKERTYRSHLAKERDEEKKKAPPLIKWKIARGTK